MIFSRLGNNAGGSIILELHIPGPILDAKVILRKVLAECLVDSCSLDAAGDRGPPFPARAELSVLISDGNVWLGISSSLSCSL